MTPNKRIIVQLIWIGLWNYQNFSFLKLVVKPSFDRQQTPYTVIMHLDKVICQQRRGTISTHFQNFVYFGHFVVFLSRSVYKMSPMCSKQRTHRKALIDEHFVAAMRFDADVISFNNWLIDLLSFCFVVQLIF